MQNRNARRGFTLMELMIAVAIILVILSVALPNIMTARVHANETMVRKMIGTIHTAQVQCQSETGQFAKELTGLAKWIPGKLLTGTHSGYKFKVDATPAGYQITATPEKPGATGTRIFTSDQTLIVEEANIP